MGLNVDWEIEAERERVSITGEDPELWRRRRRRLTRFILVLTIMGVLIGGVVTAIVLRLRYVDFTVEQSLRDTIASEVTSLRIGDRALFEGLQRSATEDWLTRQRAVFDGYQALKQRQDVNLTGNVLDISIEGQRGRALVEEVIDGTRYGRVWFYWRYDDGWHHVPPDYTFWGAPGTITADRVRVDYQSLDAATAQAVAETVSRWMEQGCAIVPCDGLQMTVAIQPGASLQTAWSAETPDTLVIRSPLADTGRLDSPFDPVLQLEAANLIGRRLVEVAAGSTEGSAVADASYLQRAASAWLVGQFLGVPSGSPLLDSFADAYGEEALGRVFATLNSANAAETLATAAGVQPGDLNVNWSDYLTWRLAEAGTTLQIQTIDRSTDAAGNPLLIATGTDGAGQPGQVIFALVNGRWERTA
jgi:hypothetical protein